MNRYIVTLQEPYNILTYHILKDIGIKLTYFSEAFTRLILVETDRQLEELNGLYFVDTVEAEVEGNLYLMRRE